MSHCHRLFFALLPCGLLAFQGCQSTAPAAQPSAQPTTQQAVVRQTGNLSGAAWWQTPPRNTRTHLIGVGSGVDQESALKDALNAIAASLSTEVSSTFEESLSEREVGGSTAVDRISSLRIRQEVGALHFNNYDVVDSHRAGSQIFLRVQVNRQLLREATLQRWQSLLSSLDLNLAANTPPLSYTELLRFGKQATTAGVLSRLGYTLIALGVDRSQLAAGFNAAAQVKAAFAKAWNAQTVLVSASPDSREIADLIVAALRQIDVDVRTQMLPIPPDTLVINIRGGSRIVPAANGRFDTFLQRSIQIRQGNSTFFSENFNATGNGLTRAQSLTAAEDALLNQLLDKPATTLFGW